MKKLEQFVERTWMVTSTIAGFLLVMVTFVIIANIILRRFFNFPIFGSTEIVRYLALIGSSFALAQNEWKNGNIRMTVLVERTTGQTRRVINFISYTLISVGFVYVTYHLMSQMVAQFYNGAVTMDLKIPMYVFSGFLSLGFILLTICLMVKAVLNGYSLWKGTDSALENGHADY